MARRGKGVRRSDLYAKVGEVADDLFVSCDAVVIVAYRKGGNHDNGELIAVHPRGDGLALSKAIDILSEYEPPNPKIEGSLYGDDEDDEENESD